MWRRQIDRGLISRFSQSAVWSVAAAVATSSLNLGSLVLVARLVGKETYGHFVLLQSTINTFALGISFAFGAAATKYIAARRTTSSGDVAIVMKQLSLLSIIAGLIIVLTISISAYFVGFAPQAAHRSDALLIVAAFAAPPIVLDGIYKGAILGLERFRAFALSSCITSVINLVFFGAFSYLFSIEGLALALVISAWTQCAVSAYVARTLLRGEGIVLENSYRLPFQFRLLATSPLLLRFVVPASLAGFIYPLATWYANVVLAARFDFGQVALLAVGLQWLNAIMFVANYAGRAALPILAALKADRKASEIGAILKFGILVNVVVTLPAALAIFMFAGHIAGLYGPEFMPARYLLQLAAPLSVLIVASAPLGQLLAASDRMWPALMINVLWGAVFAFSATLLIESAAVGVFLALIVSYFAHALVSIAVARRMI